MELSMARIYTRTGDRGTTSIHGRIRVSKTDPRIEANGALDELNVAVGTVRSFMEPDDPRQEALRGIQLNIMPVMSLVATRSDMRAENPNTLPESLVSDVEARIDSLTAECGGIGDFILPGGTRIAALLHGARVAARRAERRLWELDATDKVPDQILCYINRLSDLFFIMARHEMKRIGADDEIWKSFAYKREKK